MRVINYENEALLFMFLIAKYYSFTNIIFLLLFLSTTSHALNNDAPKYSAAPNDSVIQGIKALYRDPKQELAKLENLLDTQPASAKVPEWLYISALGYQQMGETQKAEQFIEQCINDPRTNILLVNRAKLLKAKLMAARGNSQAAIKLLISVISWAEDEGIVQLKIGTLMTLGTVYSSLSQLEFALENFTLAYELATKIDTQIPSPHIAGLIGKVYQKQQEHRSALLYLQEAVSFAISKNNLLSQAKFNLDIALSEMMLNQHNEAFESIDKALQIAESIHNNALITQSLIQQGKLYNAQNTDSSLNNAFTVFTQAISIAQSNSFTSKLVEASLGLAETEFKRHHYTLSLETLHSIELDIAQHNAPIMDIERHIAFHSLQANVYEAMGQYHPAVDSLNKLIDLKTAYWRNHITMRSQIMKTLFELDKAEEENIQLKAVALTQAEELYSSQQRNVLMGLCTVLMIFLTLSLYLQYNKKIRYQNKLEKLATTDGLTQLYNRRRILQIIENKLTGFHQHHTNYVVVMIDIDLFKSINDCHGHQKGDESLILFAQEATRQLGAGVDIGRIGGEEFLLLFEDQQSSEVEQQITRFQQQLYDEANIRFDGAFTLSFSAGALTIDEPYSIKEILNKTDIALYQAKSAGRNKMIFYNNLSSG